MRKHRSGPISLFSFQDILTSLMGVVFLMVLLLSLELVHRIPSVSDLPQHQAAQLQAEIQQMQTTCQQLQKQLDLVHQQAKMAAQTHQQLQQHRKQLQQDFQRLWAECQSKKKTLRELTHQKETLEKQLHSPREGQQMKQLREKIAQIHRKLGEIKAQNVFIFNPVPGEKLPWVVDMAGPAWQVISVQTFRPVATFHQTPEERLSAFVQWARNRNPRWEYFILFVRPAGLARYYRLRERLERMGFELGVDLLGDDQKLVFGKGQEP